MAHTGSTDMSSIPQYYNLRFIERLIPQIAMMDIVEMRPLPANSGTVMYFPRISNSSTTVSAYKSTEGTAVTPEKIGDIRVSATVEKYRNAKSIWDVAKITALNGYFDAAVDEQADQASQIIDKRILESAYGTSAASWGGGFSIQFADLVSGTDWSSVSAAAGYIGTSKTITAAMVRRWVGILRSRQVKPYDSGFFQLVVHSNTEMAIQADSTWQVAAGAYTNPELMQKGLFGRYAGAEMRRDNNVYTSANGSSGATLYYSLLLGRGSMAVSQLNGGVQTFMKESGDQDTSNPVNEFVVFGWKIMFVPVILNVSCGLICVTSD
jgi:N4-gp56 family major capsid protein